MKTDVDQVREALEKLIQMWTTGGCGSVNAVELGNQALSLLDGKVLVSRVQLAMATGNALSHINPYASSKAVKALIDEIWINLAAAEGE